MRTLGWLNMQSGSSLLIWLNSLFLAAMALSGTFINIYIFRVDHSVAAIGQFNFFEYIAYPFAFLAAGKASSFVKEIWFLRAGVVLLTGFFLWIIMQGNAPMVDLSLLGILYGFGQGIYWFGFNILSFDWTTWETRPSFQGTLGFAGSIATTAFPFVAGILISKAKNFSGYHLVFIISLMLFAFLLLLTAKATHSRKEKTYHLREGFRFRADPDWFRLWVGTIAFGLREGVYAFFISIVVYSLTKSEEFYGMFSLVIGTLSFCAFFLAGRLQKWKVSKKALLFVAATLLGVLSLLWLVFENIRTLWVFGVFTALFFPVFMVPYQTILLNEIEETRRSIQHRTAYFISREVALALGRLTGVGLIWWVAANYRWPQVIHTYSLIGLGFIITAYAIRKVEFKTKKEPSISGAD